MLCPSGKEHSIKFNNYQWPLRWVADNISNEWKVRTWKTGEPSAVAITIRNSQIKQSVKAIYILIGKQIGNLYHIGIST